jgi:WD40 repeat protein
MKFPSFQYIVTALFSVAITGAYDCAIRFWNINTGDLLHLIEAHKATLNAIAIDDSNVWPLFKIQLTLL